MIPAWVRRIDAEASGWLRARRLTGARHRLLSALAHSGDSIVVLPLLGLAWWRSGFRRRGVEPAAAAAVLSAMALVVIAKLAFRRARPEGEWGAVYRLTDPHSFPSGHAARTMALAVAMLVVAGPCWGLPVLGWSIALGLSRVNLGVHWFLDVLVGWALGAGAGLVASIALG